MADTDVLVAPNILEYPYTRTVGPVLGRFMTGLRDGRIEGIRASDGRVLVPPAEYDPVTSESLDQFVEVGQAGVVTTWTWVTEPRPPHPLERPFAWALIRLDGADTALRRGRRGDQGGSGGSRPRDRDDLLRRQRQVRPAGAHDPLRLGHDPSGRGGHRPDAPHPGGRSRPGAHGHAGRGRLVTAGGAGTDAREHQVLPAHR